MSRVGTPLIADFGNSRREDDRTSAISTIPTGSVRWMAKELLVASLDTRYTHMYHTKATDVWAFAMVIVVSACMHII